nr:kremen protein 2 [Vulpes vulpes]
METGAPQGLLLLLFLPLLLPRGASAASLHSPGLSECFQVNGADYRGHQNRTGPRGAGRPCLFWDQTQQHSYSSASDPQGRWGLGPHNFCRNPDGDVQPWCYVAETEEGIYWRYCDIPTCHMPGYLGCFVDSGTPPALSGPSGTSTKLTVQVCLRFCRMKGYQLAGVEAGYACFCGSESDLDRGRLQDAADDPAPEGLAQTPAAPLDGANASCSPRPGAPEAVMGARVFPTVAAVSVLLLLLLSLLRLLRRRSCLLTPGKGPPALGPSRGPGRSWAVWYRGPRGVALPCPPGDPQAEGLAASYRPLSASSQSSLRSLISAL